MAGRIEDYALIGDMQTAALVCRDGTVDWLCLPRFDSPAVFAGLLGTEEHGFWRMGPVNGPGGRPAPADRRRYRGDSLVLESEWDTPRGTVRVIDFMPPRDGAPQLIRIVEGVSGRVPMRSELRMRFSYGWVVPWVHKVDSRTVAVAGPDSVWLDTEAETYGKDLTTFSDFTVSPGERIAFTISWEPSHKQPPAVADPEGSLEATEEFWREWVEQCTYHGPYRDAVVRSLITLKALTYAPTGGIVAAPTTSLPECIGGVRNWDYRFTWLRDAAITLSSLLRTGYREEARAWREWLLRAVAGDPENLQIMYGITGERDLPERELRWLPGYENSAPVRIGNGAADQVQLDIYGSVLDAVWRFSQQGGHVDKSSAKDIAKIADWVAEHWEEPDNGIWESRAERTHYTQSKAMCWLALHRACNLAEAGVIPDRSERWKDAAHSVRAFYETNGWDAELASFIRAPDLRELDAALLTLSLLECQEAKGERMVSTIEAIKDGLARGPYVYRYLGEDNLPAGEGAFLACSFWLAACLARAGRIEEAQERMEQLVATANDVGLYSEEIDPETGEFLGNFPQGLTHLALVNAASAIQEATA